jgi:hypothetical protein
VTTPEGLAANPNVAQGCQGNNISTPVSATGIVVSAIITATRKSARVFIAETLSLG